VDCNLLALRRPYTFCGDGVAHPGPRRRPQHPADILEINIPVVSILWHYSKLPPAQSVRFTLNQRREPAMLLPSNSLVVPADGPQVAAVEECSAAGPTVKNTVKKQ
jgi:hypothetical protein